MEPHSTAELIVSIDFGSTYVINPSVYGLKYKSTKKKSLQHRFTKVHHAISTIHTVTDYQPRVIPCKFDSPSGVRRPFVPSIIQYSRSGDIVGWGFDPIAEGAVEIKGIKLCLPHEDDRMVDPSTYPVLAHAIQHRKDLGKTVVTVLTDFMTRLWQVCKPQITNDKLDVSWRLIITHPVGWNIDKLEQAIDTAIVMPDQSNSTYTICFQEEAEAALIGELHGRGIKLAYDSNKQPRTSLHRPTGQGTYAQDGETVVVADFGGLTVDIASGRLRSQTGIEGLIWQAAPASRVCGASLFGDAFMNLLRNKAKMLLKEEPPSDWFSRALRLWEYNILPSISAGSCPDLSFDVAQEDFQDGARIAYHRLESIMEFYLEQAVAALREQINNLRDIQSVSRGAALYGLYLSPTNTRSGPDRQSSDISILIDNNPINRIILVRKGELLPRRTIKRIPIKGNLMQRCFEADTKSYKLDVYSTTSGGTLALAICIRWQHFQREVMADDICVLEIRLHGQGSGGMLTSFVHNALFTVLVNGVKQGRTCLSYVWQA
ncbi:hypothetical protein NUW58_g1150 [Xylaria curta]|uniref:Uncharacterized protein n=1 Tax=Xylaria curta TaxID=42375 RepID=A0ACC1PLK6_9PEZI|nr:hypothetical protein NUW58_g1150 [Xylaria curta]